jgi:RNA polymerase sigma-70 factor, ECF subfamily
MSAAPVPEALERLMQRYQQADTEAGGMLAESLSAQMFQFFLAQVRNRTDAEDLLQNFWLRIHNARRTYRPGEPLLPWLYAIAHRVRIDYYRRNRRVAQHEIADENMLNTAAQERPSAGPHINELLKQLPESQREVLLMMKVSGLTLEEVARATGSSVGAVKQKAHRAYEKLRKLLSSTHDGGDQ